MNFAGGAWWMFSGLFPWKKQEAQIHGKIQIRIWEFHGQNPHCKDLAVMLHDSFQSRPPPIGLTPLSVICGPQTPEAYGDEILKFQPQDME